MTVETYIADKLSIITESGKYEALGKAVRVAGIINVVFSSYKTYVAVSDGEITAGDVIGVVSTGLGIISLFTGVGLIGLTGVVILSSGSFVLGLISQADSLNEDVLLKWETKSICP